MGQIERVRHTYDWNGLDSDVAMCLARGIVPYCLIVNTPAWASPTGQATHAYAPLSQYNADFQSFCTALAARYAGQITSLALGAGERLLPRSHLLIVVSKG